MQRGIERSLLYPQGIAGDLLQAFGDRPPVERLERQSLEDEQVESALREIEAFVHWRASLSLLQKEHNTGIVEVQGESSGVTGSAHEPVWLICRRPAEMASLSGRRAPQTDPPPVDAA